MCVCGVRCVCTVWCCVRRRLCECRCGMYVACDGMHAAAAAQCCELLATWWSSTAGCECGLATDHLATTATTTTDRQHSPHSTSLTVTAAALQGEHTAAADREQRQEAGAVHVDLFLVQL